MNREHEIAVIGGGIAGSALAIALAGVGARVALIERAAVFNDRVRGEWLAPWGVAESRRLGLASVFRSAGAHEVPWNVSRSGKPRRQATPGGDVPLTFFHPVLQEALLTAAADAGVEVIRPGLVEEVRGGPTPTVTIRRRGRALALRASLVVGPTAAARRSAGCSSGRSWSIARSDCWRGCASAASGAKTT